MRVAHCQALNSQYLGNQSAARLKPNSMSWAFCVRGKRTFNPSHLTLNTRIMCVRALIRLIQRIKSNLNLAVKLQCFGVSRLGDPS